jgi:hypothetical protein
MPDAVQKCPCVRANQGFRREEIGDKREQKPKPQGSSQHVGSSDGCEEDEGSFRAKKKSWRHRRAEEKKGEIPFDSLLWTFVPLPV